MPQAPRKVARMAVMQFLGKYRETGLLVIRASLGLIFIILIAPVLWSGQGSWGTFRIDYAASRLSFALSILGLLSARCSVRSAGFS